MPDDIDAKIPPNTKEMLDNTSKEGVQRSRRISSLTNKIVEMEKQVKLDSNKMSDQISKISKKQRTVREELKGVKNSTIPEIEAMAPEVNKILTGISGAVGSLAVGMKRITLDTASSAKNVVGQYGKAISEDISINRENMMAMSLAKATPIFGYFAAKFMQTDVFKSAASKIKQSLSSAISSAGSKAKSLIPSKVKSETPKMAAGGYVKKGGFAEVHPAEVIGPIDKVMGRYGGGGGEVQEQTLETLKDLSSNMKTYGNYFQKEKMQRKGIIKDYVSGLWQGKYGKSWEFRMLIATEKLQEAISGTPGRFKYAWETIMWKHPIFRKLIGLTNALYKTAKGLVSTVWGGVKWMLGIGGPYAKNMTKATSIKSGFGQISSILATIYTTLMPKIDTLIRNSGSLVNFVLQESGYQTQLKDTSRFGRMMSSIGKKKPEQSLGMRSNLLSGPEQMSNDIRLIEENTRKESKSIKLLAPIQKDLLLEQKKTRRNIGIVGRGLDKVKKTLKSSGQFIWKLIMMGFGFIQPLLRNMSASIIKYLPLILAKLGPLAAAGIGGYMLGEYYNKKIDEAFGERGGLGKWIYDQTHKYGEKWYQVAWGFANLSLEASTQLQKKVKKNVLQKIEAAYDKYTPGWIKSAVSFITTPFKKAAEFREKAEKAMSVKAKEVYDKYVPDVVKSTLGFITAPFKNINKWLTEDAKTIEEKAEKVREATSIPVTDKVIGFFKGLYEQSKKIDAAWDQMGVNLRGGYNEMVNTIKYIWHLPGKIIDLISWPFRKVSDLIFNIKQWSLQKLRSIPIIGKWISNTEDDSWLKKAKLNKELDKDKAWDAKIDSVKNFIYWPFRKMVELKDKYKIKLTGTWDNIVKNINSTIDKIGSFISWPFTKMVELKDDFKKKITDKFDITLKGLDGYVDKIVELITWPILKMVELVQKAKDWTMKKLEDTPLVGRIMKWFNKEGNKSTTKPELPPKKTESYNDLGYFAKGGITTRSGVGRLHASEAVIPLPPSVTEAITGRFIDRSEIAKRDTASRIAEGRFAAGEFGKKTGDITSQLKQGQAQINNAMVYTSNMMSNSNSSVASTIADSMSSKGGGGFSSGNDFASQVLKCNLS